VSFSSKRGTPRLGGPRQRSALPWLLGVANHASHNATRSLRRYSQALKRLDGHRNTPSDDAVIDRIDAETSLNLVNEVIRDLTEQEREIVCCFVFWSGLTYEATGGGARSFRWNGCRSRDTAFRSVDHSSTERGHAGVRDLHS